MDGGLRGLENDGKDREPEVDNERDGAPEMISALCTKSTTAGSRRRPLHLGFASAFATAASMTTAVTTAETTYMATAMSASSAAAMPTMKSGATSPAKTATICVAAPIPARPPPASIIPAVVLAAEKELRLFHGCDLDRRDSRA
jgi:hypothetical protein